MKPIVIKIVLCLDPLDVVLILRVVMFKMQTVIFNNLIILQFQSSESGEDLFNKVRTI